MKGVFMNQKGDFFIYLIFSAVIVLIAAIIFYVYQGQDSFNLFNNTSDLNFSSTIDNKLPPVTNQKVETYKSSYNFKTEIEINNVYDLKDNNISIIGKPNLLIAEREFILKNPYFTNFKGSIGENIEGTVNKIYFEDSEIIIKSKIYSDLNDVEQIIIENLKINFENTNINGKVYLENNNLDLDKAYLNFKGFEGVAIINPATKTIIFEGKIGYLKIKNKGLITILE